MRYLKKEYSDGTTRYIQLDGATFEFEQVENMKYRVNVISNGQTFCISEPRHIYDSLDKIIKRVANLADGVIIKSSDLW